MTTKEKLREHVLSIEPSDEFKEKFDGLLEQALPENEQYWLLVYQCHNHNHRNPDSRFHNCLHHGSVVDWLLDARKYLDVETYFLVNAIPISEEEYLAGDGYIG